ncbi:choice-of-anchor D domain-containing protein [Nocardioides lijunqiniae]|uniref:choice-of-anchor D domain-containing protein n=1 Tax=Nocardioides lijunqiniae TaxID=2760832 RepID=UPI0018786164|nr:choice-of-anchor D domain-containing protein [Nocardioides lijunqiniae]
MTTAQGVGRRRTTSRTTVSLLMLAVMLPALAAPGQASAAAKRQPDLTVAKVAAAPAVRAGTSMRISTTLKNTGTKAAGASLVGLSLSRDRKVGGDTGLAATSKVTPLRPRKSVSRRISVAIPARTAAGSYYLIVCADSSKKVRERSEKNNCRVSTTPIRVTASGPAAPSGGKLTLAPATYDFQSVAIGSAPAQKTITATNTGTGSLPALTSAALTGDSGFAIVTDECVGKTLGVDSACNLVVSFGPAGPGTKAGSLTVRTGAGPGLVSATAGLQGTGVDPLGAHLTSELGGQEFGTVSQGVPTPTTTFTISNDGTYESGVIGEPAIENGAATGFKIVSQTCAGVRLDVGESCTVSVNLEARTHGPLYAKLWVSAAPGGDLGFVLTATGRMGFLTWNSHLDFGTVAIGDQSGTQRINPANATSDTQSDVSVTISGPDADQFQLGWQSCSPQVAPRQSCSIEVAFRPTSPGAKSAQLSLGSTPGGIVAIALTGSGRPMTVAPTSRSFSAFAGETTQAMSFTITNLDAPTTGPLSSQLTGPDAAQFRIVSDGCSGATLTTGSTCSVTVVFEPTGSHGGRSAALVVSGLPGDTATASLAGTVRAPAMFSVVPFTSINFGTVPANLGYSERTLLLRNTGEAPSGVLSLGLVGENVPDQFFVYPDECGGIALAPNATCLFRVRFDPSHVGSVSASIAITAPGALTGLVPLSGVGS